MTDVALAACPACAAAPGSPPESAARAAGPAALRRFDLALPGIHCAACIDGVETALAAEPGVAAARVHLGLKRVAVTAEDLPGTETRLIAALQRRGFPAQSLDPAALDATRIDAEGRDLLARIGVAGFASMNVMLLSISVWAGATESTRDLMHWISAAITLPAVFFSAWPFFASAARSLAAGRMDMDVPISTGILMAAAVSLWETVLGGRQAFFEAAIMLTFFLLVGRYLAHRTRAAARSAAAEIAALEVRLAIRIRPEGGRETVPVDALRPGDIVAVPVGARVPVDGSVVSGRSDVDASMLTGETMPQTVEPGAEVRAGMTNLAGPIEIRADALGEDTLLRRIGRLVETAERSRTRYATLSFRAARIYGPMVYALAILAFLVWGFGAHDWRVAANVAAAVLIITCPCGLGLAVPAVLTTASGRLYREGVLFKDGASLERLAEIDAVVFDKTGTLTTGRPILVNAGAISRRDLELAAALAEGSTHPLSRAVASAGAAAGLAVPRATDVTEHAGLGSAGLVDGVPVRLGRAEWIGATEGGAHTVAWLRVGEAAPKAFLFADEPRGDAAAVVAVFRAAGLPVTLLSGDVPGPVAALAAEVGISDWVAGATPQEKVARLDAMRAAGRKVLMVGDGLNDAAALAAAHVSISPASAVDASRNAADMIVVGSRLAPVAEAWRISVAARRRIVQNIVFAFAYNVITVPVAFAGLVTPLFAALAMSGSSLVVCLNAFRLGGRRR